MQYCTFPLNAGNRAYLHSLSTLLSPRFCATSSFSYTQSHDPGLWQAWMVFSRIGNVGLKKQRPTRGRFRVMALTRQLVCESGLAYICLLQFLFYLARVCTHIQGPYMVFLFGLSRHDSVSATAKARPAFSVISKPHPNYQSWHPGLTKRASNLRNTGKQV